MDKHLSAHRTKPSPTVTSCQPRGSLKSPGSSMLEQQSVYRALPGRSALVLPLARSGSGTQVDAEPETVRLSRASAARGSFPRRGFPMTRRRCARPSRWPSRHRIRLRWTSGCKVPLSLPANLTAAAGTNMPRCQRQDSPRTAQKRLRIGGSISIPPCAAWPVGPSLSCCSARCRAPGTSTDRCSENSSAHYIRMLRTPASARHEGLC